MNDINAIIKRFVGMKKYRCVHIMSAHIINAYLDENTVKTGLDDYLGFRLSISIGKVSGAIDFNASIMPNPTCGDETGDDWGEVTDTLKPYVPTVVQSLRNLLEETKNAIGADELIFNVHDDGAGDISVNGHFNVKYGYGMPSCHKPEGFK